MTDFPTPRLRRFFWLYKILWTLGLPFAIAYLFWRGRRDPLYRGHLGERFGRYPLTLKNAVWVHAVSLGELRSAVPLIQRLLAEGETIVTTHFTPAGRREAERVFASEIAQGRVRAVWIPLEFKRTFRKFFKAFTPRYGLVMEIEIWPEMIRSAAENGVPLFACNAQYPHKSFTRDIEKSKWRLDLHKGLAGAFVKSDLQRDRFIAAGCPNIHVTGELRFDQPIPQDQVAQGDIAKAKINRPTITITSVVKGEDDTYIQLIKSSPERLFIYVPRAPERFEETYQMLTDAGLKVARRSDIFDDRLTINDMPSVDVILGDSMGEMYFYLALCDAAIIGGSFVEKGAHNISEPLALGKPVIVGPHTWTIEFPIVEAIAANAAVQVADNKALLSLVKSDDFPTQLAAEAFFKTQEGAVNRTLDAIKIATQPLE
ncbi:3-deoxy-D-manno-octulosonic-acid transferase [Loktanella ponticola]|uniref:3-deoxy-D-manno-octulosonic acid transferase n=1 Tax=Yoonia ponticola TaxID=1524255 RepID=A0A7W9BLC6_9RHOB|nr:glycosyltransferase N-terminal domain-containing protein [Yoonia ponticola]MBB5722644.1 3-deoxy-D-manno-octulosonic-acid transferase [Yoonia ponticola]